MQRRALMGVSRKPRRPPECLLSSGWPPANSQKEAAHSDRQTGTGKPMRYHVSSAVSVLAFGGTRVARPFSQRLGLVPVAMRAHENLAARRPRTWRHDDGAPVVAVVNTLLRYVERVVSNRQIPVPLNQRQRIRTLSLRVPVQQISHPPVVHSARQTGGHEAQVGAASIPSKKSLEGDDAGTVNDRARTALRPHTDPCELPGDIPAPCLGTHPANADHGVKMKIAHASHTAMVPETPVKTRIPGVRSLVGQDTHRM